MAIAMVLVAGIAYVLGVQAGKPDPGAAATPTTQPSTSSPGPTTTTEAAPTAVPAGTFQAMDDPPRTKDKGVVAFLLTGGLYYPQGLCAKGNGIWQCMTNGTHLVAVGAQATPVAVPVPTAELPGLVKKAADGVDAEPKKEWGDALPRHP